MKILILDLLFLSIFIVMVWSSSYVFLMGSHVISLLFVFATLVLMIVHIKKKEER